jgi:hypothetical protein
MPSNLDRYRTDLERLKKLGSTMEFDLQLRALDRPGAQKLDRALENGGALKKEEVGAAKKKLHATFEKQYQR